MSSEFLAGPKLTWMDFYMYETVELMAALMEDKFYEEYPRLISYQETIRNLPNLKEYLADPNHREANRKFNNKRAKLL